MHRDVEAFFDDMLAEQQRQRHEDKPLTFGPMPAPAALAAPVKQEPEVPAPATPSEVAATEPPAPEQAAPAENEHRAAPKAKKNTAPVKQKAEAPAPAMPPEPSAPEQAAPSPEIMDDAALAALIQRDRLAGGKKKKA